MADEVIVRLKLVLIEKLREVRADDLEMVREYIKEIKELDAHWDKPVQKEGDGEGS